MASVASSSAVSLANSLAMPASTSQRRPAALRSAALRVSSRAASSSRGHVGQLELDGLVLGDGLAERGALLGVGQRGVERGPGDADGAGRDVDAPDLEHAEDLGQAPARPRRSGWRRGCGGRRRPSRRSRRPCSRACRRALLTEMPSNVGPGSFSTMNAEMPSSVRAASATMPARSPFVTHALVPLTRTRRRRARPCRRCCGCRCRRRARTATARRAARPWPSTGSQRCFCSSVPWAMISVAAIVWVLTMPVRLIHPYGQLLDDADVGQQVEAEPAVGLGDRDAEQPQLAHLLDDVGREPVLVLELRGDGDDLRATKRRTVSTISRRTSGSVPRRAGLVVTMAGTVPVVCVDVDLTSGEQCFR